MSDTINFPDFPTINNCNINGQGYSSERLDIIAFMKQIKGAGRIMKNFCYKTYLEHKVEEKFDVNFGYGESLDRNYIPNTVNHISYPNITQESIDFTKFATLISRKNGQTIDTRPAFSINIDLANEKVIYGFYFFFSESTPVDKFDEIIDLNSSFYETIDELSGDRVLAASFKTEDYNIFNAFYNRINLFIDYYIIREFERVYKDEVNMLTKFYPIVFYRLAPKTYLNSVRSMLLITDMTILLKYDKDVLLDTAKSVYNILTGFKDLQFIYKHLYNNPGTVKIMYSFTNKEEDTDSFCSFISALSQIFQTETKVEDLVEVKIEGGHTLNSDVINSKSNVVKIENFGVEVVYEDYVKPAVDAPQFFDQGGITYQYTEDDVKNDEDDIFGAKSYSVATSYKVQLLEEIYYHPMQLMLLTNTVTNEHQVVSAIFIKSLSDKTEWAEITKVTFQIIDIISLFIGLGLLAKGVKGIRALLIIWTDIVVSSGDLALSIPQVEKTLRESGYAGIWFADNWKYISATTSFTLMGTQLLKGIARNGDEAITNLKKTNGIDPTLVPRRLAVSKKMEELMITFKNFLLEQPNFPNFVNGKFDIIQGLGHKMTKLRDEGVLLIKGTVKGEKYPNYYLIYKEVVIESAKRVGKLNAKIREIVKKGGKRLGAYLDDVFQESIKKNKLTKTQLLKATNMMKEFQYKDLLKVGKAPPKKLPCFLAGTMVLTHNGLQAIESIKVGDTVESYNQKTNTNELNKVTELHRNFTLKYVEISTQNETLKATGKHLFYLPETKKWISASKLKIGMQLMNDSHEKVSITDLKIIDNKENTYNLEIENNPNYYVGKDQVLTHNKFKESVYNQVETIHVEFYSLIDNTREDRYIGQTIQGTEKRYGQHKYDFSKGKKAWFEEIRGHLQIDINGKRGPFDMTPFEAAIVETHEITSRGGKKKNPKFQNPDMKPLFNAQNPISKVKFKYFKEIYKNNPNINPCRFYV